MTQEHQTTALALPDEDQFKRDILHRLYLDGFSIPEIARLLYSTYSTVRRQFVRYQIPRRTKSQSMLLAIAQGKGKPKKRRIFRKDGYIQLWQPQHPAANKYGYVLEHRVVMEQKAGRHLSRQEQVHHINGDRRDNRIENLLLVSSAEHNMRSAFCSNCELRKEIRMLRLQVKFLAEQIQGKLLKEVA